MRCGADSRPVLRTKAENGRIWLWLAQGCVRRDDPAKLARVRRVSVCGGEKSVPDNVCMTLFCLVALTELGSMIVGGRLGFG